MRMALIRNGERGREREVRIMKRDGSSTGASICDKFVLGVVGCSVRTKVWGPYPYSTELEKKQVFFFPHFKCDLTAKFSFFFSLQ